MCCLIKLRGWLRRGSEGLALLVGERAGFDDTQDERDWLLQSVCTTGAGANTVYTFWFWEHKSVRHQKAFPRRITHLGLESEDSSRFIRGQSSRNSDSINYCIMNMKVNTQKALDLKDAAVLEQTKESSDRRRNHDSSTA